MEGSPEPASKPKRVNYGKESFVLQIDAMTNPEDHRPGDISRNPHDYSKLQQAEEHIHDLVETVLLRVEAVHGREHRNRTIHAGNNLVYPEHGVYGRNPDEEVGLQDKKIERSVDAVFSVLHEKIRKIKQHILSMSPFNIEIKELAKLLPDGTWSDMPNDHTWEGTLHRLDNHALKTFRLSLDFNNANPSDSRFNFLQHFLYRLDRKLRHDLYSATKSNGYPIIEHTPDGEEDDDTEQHTQFHPVFRYKFDKKSGFTVSLAACATTKREPEPGTGLYFRCDGLSENIEFHHNDQKINIDVGPFIEKQRQIQQQNFMTA